jgi:hypothetical protein
MKKATKFLFALAVCFAIPAAPAFADGATSTVPVHLEIETATTTIFNGAVDAAPCPESPGSATTTLNGFCLFDDAGVPVDTTWYSWGVLINSIGGDSMAGHYWGFFVNGDYSQVGVSDYLLQPNGDILWALGIQPLKVSVSTTSPAVGDTVTVTVTGFDDVNTYSFAPVAGAALEGLATTTDADGVAAFVATSTDPVSFTVSANGFLTSAPITITAVAAPAAPPTPPASGGGSGGGIVSHYQLNAGNALAYLAGAQHADGSFDAPFLSDWAALAFASADAGPAKDSLRNYMLTAAPALSSVTDYERHAMALEALGINPYSGTGTDYIQPIVNAFDGTQVGDASLDNDDIFALFPLLSAGYGTGDGIIQKTVAFILSRQGADGSWNGSVDVTAAAVQALAQANSLPDVPAAMTKAENYLHAQQKSDGGFGNSFSTSWALQAIAALGESAGAWGAYTFTPQDYLAAVQQSDGGVEPTSSTAQTRVWATEYAIPASLGKAWPALLQSFSRPAPSSTGGNSTVVVPLPASATSTLPVATSTPAIATSTPPGEVLGTSTPILSPPVQSTTTAATPTAHRIKTKIKTTLPSAAVALQPAAATNAPAGNFFSTLWSSLVSFIIHLLY